MHESSPNDFNVVYSELVRTELKALAARAAEAGEASSFASALQQINYMLHHDPMNFGDPYYNLRTMKFTLCSRVVSPLQVVYSVSDEKRLVFVRSFKPYPVDAF